MSKSKNSNSRTDPPGPPGDARVNVHESAGGDKPVWRTFPGPRNAGPKLRVAMERSAYADLIAHARESLEAEVCGVLAGQVCEDDEGVFVHVEAMIRGTAASQGTTHVTFTQATWNAIHQQLERDYPRLKIVGWYHTHPGFGVEFSEMDVFIQRNFFSGPAHIALVTDPLSGAVAICTNTPQGIEYLGSFWVDSREQQCRVPERLSGKSAGAGPAAAPGGGDPDTVRALEARVGQLLQALDEMRRSYYRFLLTCGVLVCVALIVAVGYTFYSQWKYRIEPPRLNQIVPVPVQIGDKAVILGVAVMAWDVPPELNALMLQAELLKQQAAEEAAREQAALKDATNGAPAAATNAPPPPKP
jgi:proteasome lid subunit RPN8/RPN11